MSTDASRLVGVIRVGSGPDIRAHDRAAAEEPLEIRLGASPFVVIMRTPGHDRELAAGFLLSERLIRGRSDIGTIRHCTDGDEAAQANVLNVWLAGDAAEQVSARLADRRLVMANSSCGVCGRRSIDDLMDSVPTVDGGWKVSRDVIVSLPDRLRAAQRTFDETGGLHAAGLFDVAGTLIRVAEDVGRHNAVDKVIGGEVLDGGVPIDERLLFVSGRTSFEIVQKAVVAGIPVVAAVSAPSSLAIDVARAAGVTLVGFVRGATFNIYTAPERIAT
jgi:FdhD protein